MSKTFFIDLDGTVFHQDESIPFEKTEPIPHAVEKLQDWHEAGHYIVITTARPEWHRMRTMAQLSYYEVPYHQLVMGITPSTRILINNKRRPESAHYSERRAVAYEVERNDGQIAAIDE
jgi:ribonucleotide monophosphatase NagD (HAD superfamily)